MDRKSLSPLVATVLVVSALGVGLAIWEAIAPFVPHAFYGVSFTPPNRDAGKVIRVYPAELPRGVHIAIGDRIIESPEGDLLRGAAAIAYETAEANDMRERMKLLEGRLRKVESVPLQ